MAFKDSLFARSNILFTCTYAFLSFMLLIYNACIWNWLMLFDRSLQHDIDFSQDCSIRSYHFASLMFCWYYKNVFFSFSKFTFYLKSKHFTMFQYNIRGLPLFLITPSQIKMYKTFLWFIYTGFLCCGHWSTFSNKSNDRSLNIYWLTLSLWCSHAVY